MKIDQPKNHCHSYHWISQKQEIIVIHEDGEFKAYSAICPHMGARLQYDSKNKIIFCPWHGLETNYKLNQCNHHRYKKFREIPIALIDGALEIV